MNDRVSNERDRPPPCPSAGTELVDLGGTTQAQAGLLVVIALVLQLVLLAFSLSQSYFLARQGSSVGDNLVGSLNARIFTTLLPACVIPVVMVLLKLHRMTNLRAGFLWCLLLAVLASTMRVGLQAVFEIYRELTMRIVVIEWVTATLGAMACYSVAFAFVYAVRSQQKVAHRALDAEARAQRALEALKHEEVRVHRSVSEGLHGTLQQKLVLLGIELADVSEHVAGRRTAKALAGLTHVRAEVDDLRENSVRGLSRLLSPEAADVGLVPAVRVLMGRLPASLRCTLKVTPELRSLDDVLSPVLSDSQRVLAVRFVEEAMTNALKHGHAGELVIDLDGRAPAGGGSIGWLRASVRDDGRGFDPATTEFSGLDMLRRRAEAEHGTVRVSSRPGLGSTAELRMEVFEAQG